MMYVNDIRNEFAAMGATTILRMDKLIIMDSSHKNGVALKVSRQNGVDFCPEVESLKPYKDIIINGWIQR